MTVTQRLYFEDSFLFDFEARVVAHTELAGKRSVVLDRTAFYPEGGGQMADRGALGGVDVVDVQVDDAGTIHHVLAGDAPAIDETVHANVDRDRRRTHAALHTGQHILSRALADVAKAETVSSRLGETICTIDVDQKLAEGVAARVEDLANSVVDDDVPVRAFFPEPDELPALPLRRPPKVAGDVRVVRIGDFDVTPCGGTHCTHSAQVGLIRIAGVERYKKGTRVSFHAGARARRALTAESEALRVLSRDFTCAPTDVGAAVEKLRRELGEAREALGLARARVAEQVAADLLEGARRADREHVVAFLDELGADEARAVAARIAREPRMAALVACPVEGGTHVVVARAPDGELDCGALLKRAAKAAGGRGGGRPERAEGRLPSGVDWVAVASAALAAE